jgi:hypothetical protein
MDIVKSIYGPPDGEVNPLVTEDMDITLELEGEEEEEEPEALELELAPGDFNKNLAEDMDPDEMQMLSTILREDFDDDCMSRKGWVDVYLKGVKLLGLNIEERSDPWEGACDLTHPLLAEAAIEFQADTMMETFPAAGPVKTQVIGEETEEKLEAAKRVMEDMNYQLTEVMVEYRTEHERMLWTLGLSGNGFKKVYMDETLGRQVAMYCSAMDVVVPYGATSLETAERVTHVMAKTPNEILRLQLSGFYRDVELDETVPEHDEVEKGTLGEIGLEPINDKRHRILEMQVLHNIESDKFGEAGAPSPYIITMDKQSGQVLSIRRNWLYSDERRAKRDHFTHYIYIPGFGFYGLGLIHLIGSYADAGTSLLRQLIDAGTLSNVPGGFKTKGLRVKNQDDPIAPGEFRDVDVASGAIKDNIMTLPFKEPSAVLLTLLDGIVEEGRRFAAAGDMKVSDMSAQAPVGTTLAILERTLKKMSAIQARVHFAMRREFKQLRAIIRESTPDEYAYEPAEGDRKAKRSDYDMVEVIPVSNPNAATMAQKIVQFQAVMQLAQGAPQLYDMGELHRQMIEVLGIKRAEKILPREEDLKPKDPVSENMEMLNGDPVKAHLYQDHEAHMAVHMGAMQDPKIQELLAQHPNVKALQAALASHVTEHIAFEYRRQIEQEAGVQYPAPNQEMDEETELHISRLAAEAARQVLGKSQAEAAAKKAAEAQKDPLVQAQQQELALKTRKADLEDKKFVVDTMEKADRLELEEARIGASKEVAGLKAGVDLATDHRDMAAKEQAQGVKLGIDIVKEMREQAGKAGEEERLERQEGRMDREERARRYEAIANQNKGPDKQ